MGVYLNLYNHTKKERYHFGKIRGGGSIDHTLLINPMATEITLKQRYDFLCEVLVNSAGDQIEIVNDDDPRDDELFEKNYRTFRIRDLLSGGDGTVY